MYYYISPIGLAKQSASHYLETGKKACRNLSYSVYEAVNPMAEKVVDFVKQHWPKLLAYFAGWAVIILCAGFMYGFPSGSITHGFKSISIPLTIGMSSGIAFGIVLCTVKQATPLKKNSIWGYINTWLNQISDRVTSQTLLSVSVTVMLAVSTVFPYAGGAIFGLVLAEALLTAILHKSLSPKKEETTSDQKIDMLSQKAEEFQEELRKLKEERAKKDN